MRVRFVCIPFLALGLGWLCASIVAQTQKPTSAGEVLRADGLWIAPPNRGTPGPLITIDSTGRKVTFSRAGSWNAATRTMTFDPPLFAPINKKAVVQPDRKLYVLPEAVPDK